MDAPEEIMVLAAKQAAEKGDQLNAISTSSTSLIDNSLSTSTTHSHYGPIVAACASSILPDVACAVVGLAAVAGIGSLFINNENSSKKKKDKSNEETAESPECKPVEVDERLVVAVVERVKAELPALIETLNTTPSQTIVSETYDLIYRSQIAAAQEFLNENRNADLSRVKCLLHKLLPREYFEYIEQLREHQDPQNIVNIVGGHNIVAPNAKTATQSFKNDKNPKKGI